MPIHPLVAKPYNILTPIPEDADPKDAFFCIPVHSSSQYLFAFEWNNPDLCHMQQNTWTVLPQGFGSSPHLFVSVQFSRSVMSNSLQSHESQHARPPCPSPTPKVHSDSRPLSQWWHPAISSSVIPFSSCLKSFPASESFKMSQLFVSGSQSTELSALASFLPKKSQGWSPSEWTGWISLQSKGLSRVFS